MNLYNIKKIALNGNEITKIATNYNPYIKNKENTVITVQALEEAIGKNTVDCDFEFNRKHETNMTFDELIVKPTGETETSMINSSNTATIYYDNTYNIKVCYDSVANTAYYPNDAFDKATETMYIASNIKVYNENKELPLAIPKEVKNYYVNVSSDYILMGTPPGTEGAINGVYAVNGNFFYTSKGNFKYNGTASNLQNLFYKSPSCMEKIDSSYITISSDTCILKQNKIVYFKVDYSSSSLFYTMKFDGANNDKNSAAEELKTHTILKISDIPINFNIPNYVTELYVSPKLSCYSITLQPKSGLTINVHAPNACLTANGLILHYGSGYGNINLFIDKKHNAESVTTGLNEIHLTSKYFGNADLSSNVIDDYGDFTNVSKIYIEENGLYTSSTGSELISDLELLLNASSGSVILE